MDLFFQNCYNVSLILDSVFDMLNQLKIDHRCIKILKKDIRTPFKKDIDIFHGFKNSKILRCQFTLCNTFYVNVFGK